MYRFYPNNAVAILNYFKITLISGEATIEEVDEYSELTIANCSYWIVSRRSMIIEDTILWHYVIGTRSMEINCDDNI